ncbi:MAG TPA: hypothetical protein VGA56_01460 [Opitutaceae bacterium]
MPEPLIELEPKSPFRWTMFLALVLTWIVVLGLAIWLKGGAFRVLLPVILVILIVYLGFCVAHLIRKHK